jgi:hypothetical protein
MVGGKHITRKAGLSALRSSAAKELDWVFDKPESLHC